MAEKQMLEQMSEDKANIFRKEFDELMMKHGFADDNDAIALRDKVLHWLHLPSGGNLVVEGFTTGVGKMVSEVFQNQVLKEKVDQLILKVATLEAASAARVEKLEQQNKTSTVRVEKLERENKALQQRLTSLEGDKTEKSLNITIADLGRMYGKYVITPLLPKFLGSSLSKNKLWCAFCEEYRNKEVDVDEAKLTPQAFDSWLSPLARQLKVDLKLLMERILLRNLDSHCDICSTPKQQAFLKSIPSIGAQGDCGKLLLDMVQALQDPGITFTRMN